MKKLDMGELEGYNYPDDVPANTIITHNVKWHTLQVI